MILITELMETTALRWLEDRADCHYAPELAQQPARIGHWLQYADGWIVRNKTKVTEKLLRQAPQLKVVGRLGVGLDNLDCAALANLQITTVYAPGANANAVAELCLLFMLAHSRRLFLADHSTRQGAWARQSFTGRELQGKTVGIVGLGAVGKRLADITSAIGCRMLVSTVGPTYGLPAVSLLQLLRASDFVSLNVPLTSATRGMIGAEELALMQPHAYIINTARGEVVDETALYQALTANRIAGAALDVRASEPPEQPDPFAALDNVILTPHLGGWTSEAQATVCQMVAEDVWRVLQGARPLFPVPGLDFSFPQETQALGT